MAARFPSPASGLTWATAPLLKVRDRDWNPQPLGVQTGDLTIRPKATQQGTILGKSKRHLQSSGNWPVHRTILVKSTYAWGGTGRFA